MEDNPISTAAVVAFILGVLLLFSMRHHWDRNDLQKYTACELINRLNSIHIETKEQIPDYDSRWEIESDIDASISLIFRNMGDPECY